MSVIIFTRCNKLIFKHDQKNQKIWKWCVMFMQHWWQVKLCLRSICCIIFYEFWVMNGWKRNTFPNKTEQSGLAYESVTVRSLHGKRDREEHTFQKGRALVVEKTNQLHWCATLVVWANEMGRCNPFKGHHPPDKDLLVLIAFRRVPSSTPKHTARSKTNSSWG